MKKWQYQWQEKGKSLVLPLSPRDRLVHEGNRKGSVAIDWPIVLASFITSMPAFLEEQSI
jgi:hypothetical protein